MDFYAQPNTEAILSALTNAVKVLEKNAINLLRDGSASKAKRSLEDADIIKQYILTFDNK